MPVKATLVLKRAKRVIQVLDMGEQERKRVTGAVKQVLEASDNLNTMASFKEDLGRFRQTIKEDPSLVPCYLIYFDVWSRARGPEQFPDLDPGMASLISNSYWLEKMHQKGVAEDYCRMISVAIVRTPEWLMEFDELARWEMPGPPPPLKSKEEATTWKDHLLQYPAAVRRVLLHIFGFRSIKDLPDSPPSSPPNTEPLELPDDLPPPPPLPSFEPPPEEPIAPNPPPPKHKPKNKEARQLLEFTLNDTD